MQAGGCCCLCCRTPRRLQLLAERQGPNGKVACAELFAVHSLEEPDTPPASSASLLQSCHRNAMQFPRGTA